MSLSHITYANEILEIQVEKKSECTKKKNRALLQSIEKEKNVEIHCIFNNIRYLTNGKILSEPYFDKNSVTIVQSAPIESNEPQISVPRPSDVYYSENLTIEIHKTLLPKVESTPDTTAKPYEPPYKKWLTYYATDRASKAKNDPYKQFSNRIYKGERSYQLGQAIVSVPLNKEIGTSAVKKFWEIKNDPYKHTYLVENEILKPVDFYSRIQQNPNKKAFVLLHGYNVNFANAAIQTAELAQDLKFEGTPIFYSWPSKARLTGYLKDRKTVFKSQEKFAAFINDFVEEAPQDLYLIAHSMGSEALLATIRKEFPKNPKLQQHVKGVIFVAPDVATIDFRSALQELKDFNIPVTLYGSEKDLALAISEKVNKLPRAGYLKPLKDLVDLNGIDLIDASTVRSDFLGHALSPMAEDMSDVMGNLSKANQRSRLEPVNFEKWTYFNLPSFKK